MRARWVSDRPGSLGLTEAISHAELCEAFGAPTVPSRVALGALIIKARLRRINRETVVIGPEDLRSC